MNAKLAENTDDVDFITFTHIGKERTILLRPTQSAQKGFPKPAADEQPCSHDNRSDAKHPNCGIKLSMLASVNLLTKTNSPSVSPLLQ
jgi:hypothetical protein